MSDNSKPQIPEGNSFFLVNLNTKTGEVACSYSNVLDALALHDIGTTMLEKLKRDMLGHGTPAPAIALPGFNFPTMDQMRKKGS